MQIILFIIILNQFLKNYEGHFYVRDPAGIIEKHLMTFVCKKQIYYSLKVHFRVAKTDHSGNKKDHVTTFVAELIITITFI